MRHPSPTPLLLLLLLACGGPPAGEEALQTERLVVGAEDVVVVGSGAIASGPRIAGTLEAASKAAMRAETGGQVQAVNVELGQTVEKGQLMAQIEVKSARESLAFATAAVRAAEQDLGTAERDRERTSRLYEAGALALRDRENADSMVIAAQARLEQARAQLAGARDQVGATRIEAPMAGIVSERAVSQGDIVAPGSPLFTVIDPSSLRLEGSVPADALASLEIGTVVRFQVQGVSGRSFEGSVERIAPSVDAVTRQIPILVTVPNPEGRLVAGLFAEGRVASEVKEGLVVPADALSGEGGASSVLRIRDGKAERVAVQLGIRDDEAEQVEILSGVQVGDTLLLGAARDVSPGTEVELRAAAPDPAAPPPGTPSGTPGAPGTEG